MIITGLLSRGELCNVPVMQKSVSERITEVLPNLPKAERQVARLLLSDFPIAGVQAVAQLAEQAEVSGPTVLRLAKRLGFEGFPEFREAMWREMHARVVSPLSLYPEPDTSDDSHVIARADRVFTQAPPMLTSVLNREQFDHAVEMLADSRHRVFTAGGRFTKLPAEALSLHLQTLRPQVRYLSPGDYVNAILDARRSDLLVIFDVRRYQQDVVDFGEAAASTGMTVIVVTDPWMSPLAATAKSLLVIPVTTLGPFDSGIAALILTETLVAGVVETLGDGPKKRLERYDSLWGERGLRSSKPTES